MDDFEEQSLTYDDAETADITPGEEFAGQDTAPIDPDEAADDASTQGDESLNDVAGENEGKQLPTHVKYEDFQSQVHRRQEADRLIEVERQGREAAETKFEQYRTARDNGFDTYEAYEQAEAWTRENGYGSVANYREVKAYEASLAEKAEYSYIDEDTKAELIENRRVALEARTLLQQTQGLVQQSEMQKVSALVTAEVDGLRTELKDLGADLDPDFESILRRSSPEIVKTTRNAMIAQAKAISTNAKIGYSKAKAADAQVAPPESKGGSAPPMSAPDDKSWMQQTYSQIVRGMTKTG